MNIPLEPYFDILRKELATTLMPADDENGRRVAQYSHEILTSLLVRATRLPAIEQDAITAFAELTPRLGPVLSSLPGGLLLVAELTEHLRVRPNYDRAEATLQQVVRLLADEQSTETRQLMQEIAAINGKTQLAFCEAVEKADIKNTEGQESGSSALSATDKLAFQTFLRGRFPAEVDVEVGKSRLIVGGGSKHTYIVDLHNQRDLADAVVLRLDKSEGVVGTTVADEFALNEVVYEAGLPVPRPFALETDPGILGAPFVVVSCVKGHNIGDWNVVWEPSREFSVGMAKALAQLHAIDADEQALDLPGSGTSVKEHIADQIATFESTWRSHGRPSIVMEQAYAWLKSHLDFVEGQRCIIHCDVGCHNMLGENGELTALLDWETAAIGNPAQDLTYTEHTVAQMMSWEEYLKEYQGAGGQLPSDKEMDFYRLFKAVFRIHWQFIARSFFFAGMSSSMVHAYASQRLHMHAEKEVHEKVQMVYAKYP